MGSGFKDFAVNEVLTSSDVDNYLMKQSVMSFASGSAVTSTITSPEEGMIAYLRDADVYWQYSGTAWREIIFAGAWFPWTPVWSTDNGTTTLGNGTLDGRYCRQGGVVKFKLRFQWGTTTTQSIAGENWRFTLPAVDAYNGLTTTWHAVNAWVYDVSASTRYTGAGYIDSSVSPPRINFIVMDGSSGVVDNQTPMTWANGDRLNVWGEYEVA